MSRNGGTWARATPSEASVAQSAIAPSAQSVPVIAAPGRHRRKARRSPQRQKRHTNQIASAISTARTGFVRAEQRRPVELASPAARSSASASMSAAHSRRRGRSASSASSRRLTTSGGGCAAAARSAGASACTPALASARLGDRERRAALRAAHRLARRQRRAAGRALHRRLARRAARCTAGGSIVSSGSSARARRATSSRLGHRTAVRAALVVGADRGAAVDAVDPAAVAQQPGAVEARHRPQQPLFLEELGERLVGAVAPHALQLRRAAPARLVVHDLERAGAARAARVGAQQLVRQVVRERHLADQLEQRRAAQLRGLGAVEPDEVAADGRGRARPARRSGPTSVTRCIGSRQLPQASSGSAARAGRASAPRAVRPRRRRPPRAPAGRRGSSSAPARRRRRG